MLVLASYVANAVAGLAFLVVGATLLFLRPAREGASGFAAFALAAGAQHLFGNLGGIMADEPIGPTLSMMAYPFLLVAPIFLVWAALRYHGTVSPLVAVPFVAVGTAAAALMVAAPSLLFGSNGFQTPLGHVLLSMPYFLGIALGAGVLASRHAREPSPRLRLEMLLLLLALAPYLAYTAALLILLVAVEPTFPLALRVGYVATFTLSIAVVGWTSLRLWQTREHAARGVAAFTLVVVAAGFAQGYLAARVLGDWALFGGVLRFGAALLLGYGLLKYRIFDIDVRVKRGLGRALAAGLAIAGFFLASELAEGFVADRTGSALMGIGAAAVLLVVESRVMHVGRRLAERALPNVSGSAAYLDGRKLGVYRAAIESAARDGMMTIRERDLLATIARELGLSESETSAIEREVVGDRAMARSTA